MTSTWHAPARSSGQGFSVEVDSYQVGYVDQLQDGSRWATCRRQVVGMFARPAEAHRAVRAIAAQRQRGRSE
jgi:hypothetical protein